MRDDEGCQGNPRPASAYFSSRSRADQYSIPVSSRTEHASLPLSPAFVPSPATSPSHRFSATRRVLASLSPCLFIILSLFLSLRASPRARYRRPSQTNPPPCIRAAPLVVNPSPTLPPPSLALSPLISHLPSLFISWCFPPSFSLCLAFSLSVSFSIAPRPPPRPGLMYLAHFVLQFCILDTHKMLLIY